MGIVLLCSAKMSITEAGYKVDRVQNSRQQGEIRLYHANWILLADTDEHKHV